MTAATQIAAPPERPVYARPPLNAATLPIALGAPFALGAIAVFIGSGGQLGGLVFAGAAIDVVLTAIGVICVLVTRRRHRERLATPSTGYGADEDEY